MADYGHVSYVCLTLRMAENDAAGVDAWAEFFGAEVEKGSLYGEKDGHTERVVTVPLFNESSSKKPSRPPQPTPRASPPPPVGAGLAGQAGHDRDDDALEGRRGRAHHRLVAEALSELRRPHRPAEACGKVAAVVEALARGARGFDEELP